MLYPNSAEAAKAPMTALSSLLKSEATDDAIFHWFDKELDDRRMALAQDLTNSATVETVTVVSGAKKAKAGDILMIETSFELVQVVVDPTDDTLLTIQRGYAGSTKAAVNHDGAGINPNMVIIGSAFEEGSLAPTGVNYDPVERSNYTQIFRSTLEMTRTAAKTKLRTEDAMKEAKREALEYVGIDMERGFMWGKKSASTKNGKPIRTSDGLYNVIPAANKLTIAGGLLDADTIEAWMQQFFTFGSSEKMCFGGNGLLGAIQSAVRKNGQYNISQGEKEYGMAVTRITSPFGTLVFKAHPLLTQIAGGTTGGTAYAAHSNMGFIVDMANLKYRYLTDSDLKFEDNLQVPGMDGMKKGYIAECGYEIHHPKTHFFIYGITGGKKDA